MDRRITEMSEIEIERANDFVQAVVAAEAEYLSRTELDGTARHTVIAVTLLRQSAYNAAFAAKAQERQPRFDWFIDSACNALAWAIGVLK